MDESQYDSMIEKMSEILISAKVSSDEQDMQIINKYKSIAKEKFSLNEEQSEQLVFESLLYMKMKSNDSIDPLQKGDQFGAGFS